MAKGWTEERRRRQAEAIRKHKPWEKSTGPKTARGKERASLNALKHGLRGRSACAIRRALHHNKEFLKAVRSLDASTRLEARITNELLKNHSKSGL